MSDSFEQRFAATLELDDTDGGVQVLIPFAPGEAFQQKPPFHVRGTIDGFPFRLTLVQNKDGEYMLPVGKQIRRAIDKTWGLPVDVVLQLDTEEASFELPEDLERALAQSGWRTKFDQLPYPYRREYVQWIERAKKPETRMRRIKESVELISAGKKLS
ncbi:DUF1905 domain-containing protein [Hymenobacter aquaticus]|uniref:DUF1905 domain-containing protein n=1 Tax=Hymenobacter aquaticus TaxID=1867101 RepID=A0A4Z0PYU9_9BACT|nr:YdeI/OmpD-associated family protein [Hymenobacter aquaticus]TGE22426.1 DUF1905 domain-containing protein [Hymenobacter aquaticus]